MAAPARTLSRAARAGAVALAGVLLPLGGHVLAGGAAVPAPVVLASTLLLWAALVRRGDRPSEQRSVLALSSAVSAAQVVAHMAATAAHGHHTFVPDTPMLLGHLVAAALTVALLLRGEAALSCVLRRLDHLLPPGQESGDVLVLPRPTIVGPAADVETVPLGRVLAAAQPRRGPPR